MTWLLFGLAAVAVFAIAAAFVGTEAFRLGHETRSAIFDLDEAVSVVGDGLPEAAQARLTFEEVRRLILATLDHLRAKGLGALPGEDLSQGTDEVIVRDDDVLAVVLGAAEAQGLDIEDTDAALVIDGLLHHLDQIGALGPRG